MKYFLIDGHNLSFRSFYAMPELTNSEGFPTGALHAFVASILRLTALNAPHKTVVFFDKGHSKRHLEICPEYKANRSKTPEAFAKQLPVIKEICKAMGFAIVENEGLEGDDLLASALFKIKDSCEEIFIVSADKDFAQLVAPKIYQLLPPKNSKAGSEWEAMDIVGVRSKFGVAPADIPNFLALMGDAVDNIKGLDGVGPKTAAKWIKDFGNLENIIHRASWVKPEKFREQIAQNAELLKRNLKLVTLDTSLDVGLLENTNPDFEKLLKIFETYSLKRASEHLKKFAKFEYQIQL